MSDGSHPIDVVKTTLGGALRNGPLRVPPYQRDYAWKVSRVRKLFDDFQNAMVKRQRSYFLGTIVTTPGRPPNVIDGQQRLATTTIFLAAARDALIAIGEKEQAKQIEDRFLRTWDRGRKEYFPVLRMNTDDSEYMWQRVIRPPDERTNVPSPRLHSHRCINAAANTAKDRIRTILSTADTPARKLDALNAWIDFIDIEAIVVLLTPPDAVRAYQMFKTLNDRAQQTTPADMIKNHLFEQADDQIEEAQSKWSTMRTTIEGVTNPQDGDPTLSYLHHLSIVHYGPMTMDDMFETMEQKVIGRGNAMTFLDGLASYASDYAAVCTPTHPKWGAYDNRVSKYVSQISHEINMKFIRPLMLAVAARFSPAETHRAFRMFAAWVVRFLISGGSRSSQVETAFGDAAKKVTDRVIATANDLANDVRRVIPNDLRFHADFCRKTLANGRQARFLLRELESQERGTGDDGVIQPVDDTKTLSLEHILPKNTEAKTGWGHFSRDEHKNYRNRLGNLTLIKTNDNGAINDKPFAEKLPVIEKSKFIWLTNDVVTRSAVDGQWTMLHIQERQKKLADLALIRWPITP